MKPYSPFLILLFLCSFIENNAQEWAPIGAEWRYRTELSPTNEVWYTLIHIEKDTIVSGQVCRKYVVYNQVIGQDINIFNHTSFTFERNDSIFYWDEDRFLLRYDFSASVNDTITIPTPSFDLPPNYADSFRIVLNSISTEEVGLSNTPLGKYNVIDINDPSNIYNNGYYRLIGSDKLWGGLFKGIPLGLITYDLRCYKDANHEIAFAGFDCGFPTATNEPIADNQLLLYPNPVSNQLQVQFDNSLAGANYNLINSIGQTIITGTLPKNRTKYTINTQSIPNGILWLEVVNENKRGLWKVVKMVD